MADQGKMKMAVVPDVDIDAHGRFKYVLIKVYPDNQKDEADFKYVVRGHAWAGFHADIYDEFWQKMKGFGLDTECVGGGRIEHHPEQKKILVYGYSQGFGRAKHSVTCDVLRKKYPMYNVTWSDDGY